MNADQTAWASAALAVALVLAPPAWRFTRHLVTLVHEAGHAVVAVLTGRRLNGIRLHTDTSGLTLSTGRPRGPGMVATAAAGYLAPSALGLGSVALVRAGQTGPLLVLDLIVVGLIVLFVRNWFGLLVVGAAGAAVAVLVWKADQRVQDFAALTFAWFLLIAAPRTVLDLWSHRRSSRSRTSDADILARLTHVPAVVWNLLFLLLTGAALGTSIWLVG